MSPLPKIIQEAQRIAAQFEYPTEAVQRDVLEFMKEMEDGLKKENTTLNQIPTFVTAVPDGSEKVLLSTLSSSLPGSCLLISLLPHLARAYTWQLMSVVRISACAQSISMETVPFPSPSPRS